MQPYVIRQGDYLLRLAQKFGFDADTVWNDPKNAQLRQAGRLSQDQNILNPTDMLFIPNPAPPVMHRLNMGTTNTFTAAAVPTVTVTHQFRGDDPKTYASKAYSISELSDLTGLTTDENGVLTFQTPTTLMKATVVFSDTGESWVLAIGHLDPIETLSGIFQRLQHLGYIAENLPFDSTNLDLLRAGLIAFKNAESASASEPTPDSGSSPDSATAATTDAGQGHAGLGDDGKLDADTTNLLRQAYGC
jgi:hypothetical protein